MPHPPLGFIREQDRTPEQHAAHALAAALAKPMAHYGLPVPTLAKGERQALWLAWSHPDVVADVGLTFDRIHQITGSCVWAGGTNGLFSTISAQRLVAANPTKAFLPFTLHNYASSRHKMGDDSQGEGSMGSTFAQSLNEDGVAEWKAGGSLDLPSYTDSDGISVSKQTELAWSSYRNGDVAKVMAESKPHTVGTAAECKTTEDIKAAVLNGYGVSFACDNYIGNGSVEGSGDDAVVMGYWDGSGGHQQSIHGYQVHPTKGPLFLALNNWPRQTYPILASQPVCSVWVTEANVQKALRLHAEVYALSHLNWFPAATRLIDWTV